MGLGNDIDALVGRSMLAKVAAPAEVLRSAAGHVRSGGIVAFQEIASAIPSVVYPPCPLVERVSGWMQQALSRS
jgi:hypothetical protein